MPFVLYVCPNFTANAVRFIDVLSGISGVRLGLISQEPMALLPADVQLRLAAFQQVSDVFDADVLVLAASALQAEAGPVHRILAAVEGLQVPLAQVRERLGLEGMDVETAKNFRDKQRMKDVFRAAGLPCARSQEAHNLKEADAFAKEVGFPIVVKPVDGVGSLSTFRVKNQAELETAIGSMKNSTALLEEFVTGDEHSFDTYSLRGKAVFHSLTHYFPNPLEAMLEPWIQWQVLLPREVNEPPYDDIRQAVFQALDALGMQTGISHLEWFRRTDGSLAISEVAARPPGAQIMTLMSRAFDFDAVTAWARLMIFDEFEPQQQKYAVGAAYLRGMGKGRVHAVHGLDLVQREVGHLITDFKIPKIGQEAAGNYEGEGFIILRHRETEVVRQALKRVVSVVRVELR